MGGSVGGIINKGISGAASVFGGLPLALAQGMNGGGGPSQQDLINSGQIQPNRPTYDSLRDPTTGLMKNQYQVNWGDNVSADQRGMDAYRNMALGSGPTPWASAALNAQKLDEQNLRDSTQQQGASAQAGARSALASKYGLSPAAQERLAIQGQRAQMSGLQNVGMQGAQARAQIGMQDANTRNQFLQGLPGQDLAQANLAMANKQGNLGLQQWNIQNAFNDKLTNDAANMNTYNEQMKAWAANKQGDAMANSGSGGKK